MSVIVVRDYSRPWCGGNLNMRQLLNPLFYTRDVRHTDATRQRKSRQHAKDLRTARRLKAEYVPLCDVDRTVYLEPPAWERGASRIIECPKFGSSYRRRVREACNEVTEGDLLRRAS